MENEKKVNKVLETILIILVALSFVLLPLLNHYRNKSISLNNTQLVKRSANGDGTHLVDANGKISILSYGKVVTIYNSWNSFELPLDEVYYNSLINGESITGVNDVFGFGGFNYFRFKYNTEYSNKLGTRFSNVYDLEFYIQLTNSTFYTFTLGYYELVYEDFIYFFPIYDIEFEKVNLIPSYDVLNFTYYNENKLNQLREFIQLTLKANNLLYIWSDFQIDSRFYDNYSTNTNFINFDKDFLKNATTSSYQDGYRDGYKIGLDDASQNTVFSLLKKGISSINELLNIEVLPNVSLWLLMSIPLSISMMVIMFKLLRGD